MTSKSIKNVNFNVYNEKTNKLIEKFEWIWARTFDIDNVMSLYWNQANPKVLELGCFNWREYLYLSEKTNNYLWIDISKDAIEDAKNKYNENSFIVWDFEEYIFEWKFNIVLAFASLLHSDMVTTRLIFDKVYDLLEKWWIFYVSLKSSENYTQVTKKDEFWKRIYYYYSLDEYKKIWWEKFKVIYEDEQNFNNQKWFTLAFKK